MLLVRTVVSPKPLQAKSPVSSLLRFLQLYCTTAIRRCTKFLFRKKQHFVIDTLLTLTQISTSVQQITEVVPLKPAALTLWVALRAHVHQDTPEVENLARVGKHKQHYKSTIITYSTCWHFCFFFFVVLLFLALQNACCRIVIIQLWQVLCYATTCYIKENYLSFDLWWRRYQRVCNR